MAWIGDAVKEPRVAGLACAAGALCLGLVYLWLAGAPVRHLAINAASFVAGIALFASMRSWRTGRGADAVQAGLSLLLLATALFAPAVEGAARWIALGPLNLQVSLVVLPALIVGFARVPTFVGAGCMALAAVALALQPDRAMAGVLAASLVMLAWWRPTRMVLVPAAIALAGFAVTLVRPDALPAIPYVDGILYSAFSVGPLAGAAVIGGAALLLVPVLIARRVTSVLVYGVIWAGVILAAALGNYPTPVVGYGGSAIVGYLLSLAMLPVVRVGQSASAGTEALPQSEQTSDRMLASGLI